MEKKISIHQALSELKFYKDRIQRGTEQNFVTFYRGSTKKVGGVDIAVVSEQMTGALKSVKALIENAKIIKSAVVSSNANTTIVVGGKTYTVAEAIERKSLLCLEENLLLNVTTQFMHAKNSVTKNNEAIDDKLQGYLKATVGDVAKVDPDTIRVLSDRFKADSECILLDPNNVSEFIKVLSDDITAFKTEVDYKLSESNATTFITVNLVD